MNDKEIDLSSVHWTQGMLLMPEHFRRQERYFDSSLLWMMRYAADGYGLVGAGARGEPAERGAAKHDPVISIDDNGEAVKVSIMQCRGISPAGDIIEIDPPHAIHQAFPKQALEGAAELGVYVVCEPHDKYVEDGLEDAANPQINASRRQRYRVQLDVNAAQAPHSLMLSRLRKAEGTLRYERIAGFIPVCTTLLGYSELKRSWEQLREQLAALSDRYTQLHRAMVEYLSMAAPRGINTRGDDETLLFVGRMVMALESGIYDILDPLQSPQRFFQQLYRVIRSAAIYLDLSPPTRDYFRELVEGGVTEFVSLMEQERQTLLTNRTLAIHDNLSVDVQQIEKALSRLRRLEEALEGKYLDYRVSTALEALSFFFDRRSDPPSLYQTIIGRPARPQLFDNELTFVFAPLQLEGRQSYRVVLIRETESARFDVGSNIATEIRFNAGAGQGFATIYPKAQCEVPEQRNFAVDFDTPAEVHTISDLRIIVNTAWPIRSCLLYVRRRVIQRTAPRSPAELPRPEPPSPPPVRPPAPPPVPQNEPVSRPYLNRPRPLPPNESPLDPDAEPPIRRRPL